MRTFFVLVIALQFVVSAALAQLTSLPAASQSNLLSMDQKVKVGAIITEKTPSLTNIQFSPVVDAVVPSFKFRICPWTLRNWRLNSTAMAVSSLKS